MNKDLIKTYQFNKSIEEELEYINEWENITPGRGYMKLLKKEARKKCHMKHHSTHKRHYESHAEEQKRLAKNADYFFAFVSYDEEKKCYKSCRGHYSDKKLYRKYAARSVRREYNTVRSERPMKTEIPLNGSGYKKYFELWYTLF
jgi:hypothetical protein